MQALHHKLAQVDFDLLDGRPQPVSRRLGEVVVRLQAEPLGAVLAEGRFVLAFDDREGVEDVGEVVAVQTVEVGVDAVELGAEVRPPLLVPGEGRPS